jgi:hypothetical protein
MGKTITVMPTIMMLILILNFKNDEYSTHLLLVRWALMASGVKNEASLKRMGSPGC